MKHIGQAYYFLGHPIKYCTCKDVMERIALHATSGKHDSGQKI